MVSNNSSKNPTGDNKSKFDLCKVLAKDQSSDSDNHGYARDDEIEVDQVSGFSRSSPRKQTYHNPRLLEVEIDNTTSTVNSHDHHPPRSTTTMKLLLQIVASVTLAQAGIYLVLLPLSRTQMLVRAIATISSTQERIGLVLILSWTSELARSSGYVWYKCDILQNKQARARRTQKGQVSCIPFQKTGNSN